MRFKKITPAQWTSSPWKNGQGSTVQLVIFPEDSSLAKGDFLLRVSLATVTQSGLFSEFPGYDRALAQIEGEPLLLQHPKSQNLQSQNFQSQSSESQDSAENSAESSRENSSDSSDGNSGAWQENWINEQLQLFKPYRFSGEEPTRCILSGPEAKDINAMIQSDQGSLDMHFLDLPPHAKRKVSAADFTVLFCVRGDGRFAFPAEGRRPLIHESFEKNVTVAIDTDSPSRKFDIEVGAQGAQFLITDFLTHLG